jgi:ATP-dependent helicase/nuclease subunit A
LDATLFVEAGAGTGKTRALVDRYVALVLSGRQVQDLVAITFTEKAAAELRDRVRGELERRLTDGGRETQVLQAALADLDRAHISTIHAFALDVLRSCAAEQGIDPSFGVQDEVTAERRFQERWRAFLEDAGREARVREAVNRVLALGLTTRDIERLAHDLWRQGAVAQMLAARPLQPVPVATLDMQGLRHALLGLNPAQAPPGDLLRLDIEAALSALDGLLAAPDGEREVLLAAVAPSLRPGRFGQAANWGGLAGIARARDILRETYEALSASLAARRSEALARLLPTIVRFVIGEARTRLREGVLVFDDLILELRNALRDGPALRRRLRERYTTLLIDEFQDTDPLQVEIALAFGRGPSTELRTGPSTELRTGPSTELSARDGSEIEPGRLFLVGDPKQSIYRFRHADMAVYAATRATIEGNGGILPELALNRRSRPAILDFLNRTFAGIVGSGDQPSVQPPYRPVYAERNEELFGPGVALIGGPLPVAAREARRQEASQVAAWCQAALAQGWQVQDRDTGGVRSAHYRDIAVLVPARTILQPLERALSAAGVPYRVEGGSLIYATQEVRDLINCLTAIDDPTDDVAVVAALRSPAYACSDVELAEHRVAGGSFNYLSPDIDHATGSVATALRDLRRFHLERNSSVPAVEQNLAALTERFVAARQIVEAGMYDAGNRNAFRRARFIIEQARAFEAEGPESLRVFIDWLERRAGEAILDHEGAGLDDDEDAIRVLTIHAAKGLEFPIVFVAGLGVGPRNQTPVLALDRTGDRISVSIGARSRNVNFSLGPVDEINAQEKAHEAAERDRLLYVAATRARDHLAFFLYHHEKARGAFAQRLIDAGILEAATELPELPLPDNIGLEPFGALDVEAAEVDDEDFDEHRRVLVEAARPALVTSATALGRLIDDEPEREDESEPWARGRAGTHRGRAVHAALQVLPWDADEETLTALARAQAIAEAIPEEAARVEGLLRRALVTDVATRARKARRASREVPFALVEDGVTLEGFIDLVLEGDDGLEVIDWKTDAAPAEAVPRRLEGYRLQAGLYVLGIEAATGRPVRRITYVFIDPGVEVSPGEPATLAREARERLRALRGA